MHSKPKPKPIEVSTKPINNQDLHLPQAPLMRMIHKNMQRVMKQVEQGYPQSEQASLTSSSTNSDLLLRKTLKTARPKKPLKKKRITYTTALKFDSDARQFMVQIATELIFFVTSEASENCLNEDRRQIKGDDLVRAMEVLGLERFGIIGDVWRARYLAQKETEKKGNAQNDHDTDH
mmetsp:Transcript_8018/g.29818  ORF Transcript_8018/g.29818 Transcript_8018/m.29818 type:complete len:177 (-) Transcript_8018:564-1094(-)|eukprot:CAMPEP_0117437738 /NCGR_PEP_ID=MMETSP0759-20121206/1685_1 /TAXON_ID=63605 /ORGANISM="Percolomonas cosmopolitus, Strain WS" /LENGTH=176 /DNA_ID=CAMNT_0005229393 /DNA_START=117 /DNA_END=647 /DNA_ORIENTATION=+